MPLARVRPTFSSVMVNGVCDDVLQERKWSSHAEQRYRRCVFYGPNGWSAAVLQPVSPAWTRLQCRPALRTTFKSDKTQCTRLLKKQGECFPTFGRGRAMEGSGLYTVNLVTKKCDCLGCHRAGVLTAAGICKHSLLGTIVKKSRECEAAAEEVRVYAFGFLRQLIHI